MRNLSRFFWTPLTERFALVKNSIRITTAAILIYDVALIYVLGIGSHDFDNTISSQLLEWGEKYALLPFMSGVLMGHLYVPMRKPMRLWLRLAIAAIGIACVWLAAPAWVLLPVGALCGHAWWENAWRGR